MQNNIFLALFVGHNLVKLKEVDSTNTYLKKFLSNSKPLIEGTVIMAGHQFAGRGQNDNVWETNEGENLTFSIYLKPTFLEVSRQFYLNKAVCLGINDALSELFGEGFFIKWPNDIYYHDKKVGGILIENTTSGYTLKDSIVGIGLNVNQKSFGDNLKTATSLHKILQQDYDIDKLLSQICASIEKRYLQLKANNFNLLDGDYLKKLLQLKELKDYEVEGKKIVASIEGISPTGRLVLNINNKLKEFDMKEVRFMFS